MNRLWRAAFAVAALALTVAFTSCGDARLETTAEAGDVGATATFPPPVIHSTTTATPLATLATLATQPAAQPMVVTNTPEPAATSPVYDGQWRPIKPGLEYALVQGRANGAGELLLITRVDPRQASLRVLYEPQTPRTAREWQIVTGADLIINGGFFDASNRATGLVISDGQTFGRSYRGFGGMFSLRGHEPLLQWLRTQPYRPDPAIDQAVQGFPMLVVDSQRVEAIADNGERNRRTFIALDEDGHLLLGVTQMAQWTLSDLADFLARSPELRVRHALNLDGGASSGLWLGGNLDGLSMNSFERIPAVIAVNAH